MLSLVPRTLGNETNSILSCNKQNYTDKHLDMSSHVYAWFCPDKLQSMYDGSKTTVKLIYKAHILGEEEQQQNGDQLQYSQ